MNETTESRSNDAEAEQATAPRLEYARRAAARRAEAARRLSRFRRFGILRLAALVAGLMVGGFALSGLTLFGLKLWWWLIIPAIIFLMLADTQKRITQSRRRVERAAAYYEAGLARLDDDWAGRGEQGARFNTAAHPYAADLDLFGHGSLFELLSTARTRVGEETLAHWLLTPSRPPVIRARQAAVSELSPRLDLREDLALLGEGVRSGEQAHALTDWINAPPWLIPPSLRISALLLTLLAALALVVWIAGYGVAWLLGALILGRVFSLRWRKQVAGVIGSVDGAARDLSLLAGLLARLEREAFESPRLVELRRTLDVKDQTPSQQIARLNRLIDLLDARRNLLFAPLSGLLLWPLHFAIAIERWRQTSGAAVALWLAAVGEIEALNSLAGYAYEHPQDPFPELIDDGACFAGAGLGHPLIPDARNVRTDLKLADDGERVLIISGSNMSGKSTLLRTVGINTALALAGAPVRARSLRLTPLQIGASLRIQDSLQAGASHFYAEITRLRQVVELTQGEFPVLFLLDEILHGTNSHDRSIGAAGVVRGLIGRGSIGLVTTHDLALVRIAEELSPRAANVHFQDHLEAGKMTFDYQLRPGVVQRSNALELMRSVGLDV